MDSRFERYSEEQLDILQKELEKGNNNTYITKKYAKKWNRPERGLSNRITRLTKKMKVSTSSIKSKKDVAEISIKRSERNYNYWRAEEDNYLRQLSDDDIKTLDIIKNFKKEYPGRTGLAIERRLGIVRNTYKKDNKSLEKKVKPAIIGIALPKGMTFEGTPSRVVLHSDHFRVYF